MVTDISSFKDKEEMKTALTAAGRDPKEQTYAEYKTELDNELQKQAEGFVRVGYLLKVARDTNVLAESGYKSVAEFAQAEYGLSKDVVSRYIAINDRYSENGYSDRLQSKYEGYGYSKLTEMLTLPEEIVAEIEPSLTRKEIQEIKKEVAEEEKISPIEVAMEAAEEETVEESAEEPVEEQAEEPVEEAVEEPQADESLSQETEEDIPTIEVHGADEKDNDLFASKGEGSQTNFFG